VEASLRKGERVSAHPLHGLGGEKKKKIETGLKHWTKDNGKLHQADSQQKKKIQNMPQGRGGELLGGKKETT